MSLLTMDVGITGSELLVQALPSIYYGRLDFKSLAPDQQTEIVDAFVSPVSLDNLPHVILVGDFSLSAYSTRYDLMRKIGRQCGFAMPPHLDVDGIYVKDVATPIFALHSVDRFSSMADAIALSRAKHYKESPEYLALENAVGSLLYYLSPLRKHLLDSSPDFRAASIRFAGRMTVSLRPFDSEFFCLDESFGRGPFDVAIVRGRSFVQDLRVYLGKTDPSNKAHSVMVDAARETLLGTGTLKFNEALGAFHLIRE